MKYNIQKLQGGGFATFTPIVNPAPSATTTSQSAQEKKSQVSSILDDDMFKDLLGKGLSNDVNSLVEDLIKLENSSPTPFMQQNNRATALRIIAKINEAKQNNTLWNDAINNAKLSGGLGEVAVGSYGEVYTKDNKNNIKAVSLNDYSAHKDSIRLLTVAELMSERQQNPTLSWNNEIFNIANNSIGLSQITDRIKGLVGAIGKDESEETKFYSKDQVSQYLKSINTANPSESEKQAIKTLSKVMESPGEYTQITEKVSSEKHQINKALDYIWSTLGTGAQQKLTATAALNGVTNPKSFILDMLQIGTDESHSLITTPHNALGTGTGSGADKSSKSDNLTQFQMFFKNSLKGVWSDFMANDPNIGIKFKGAVGAKGPLVDKNDNPVPMGKLSDLLSTYQYNSMVDTSHMFFGDKSISSTDQNNIVINNSEDAGILFLPTTLNGAPDYESFKRFNDANQIFEANKANWTDAQIKKHFKQYNFDVNVALTNDGTKTVKALASSNTVKPFLVMSAYTTDAVESIVDDNKRITKLTADEHASIDPYLQSIWTVGSGKTAKNITPKNSWYNFGTPYYKGVVLAPVKLEASVMVDALTGQGPKQKIQDLGTVQYNIRNSNQQQTGGLNQMTSSSVLN